MPRYSSGGVRFHVDDLTPIGGSLGAAIDIGGITSINIPAGITTQTDDAGLLYTQSQSITSMMPEPTFTTKSLRQLLTIMGVNGFCYGPAATVGNVDGTHPGLEIYGRRLASCQDPDGGSEDALYTSAAGLLILESLDASRGADVTISSRVHALSTDGSYPIVPGYAADIPTTFVEEQFTLGHFMVGGQAFNEEGMSVSVDFGVTTSGKEPALGDVVPYSVGVRKVMPVITVSARDPSMIADAKLALAGTAATHANTKFQFRKRANRGTMTATGTSEHVLMTAAGMIVVDNMFAGSGNADATNSFRILCDDDGTNAPIVFNASTTYDTDLTS